MKKFTSKFLAILMSAMMLVTLIPTSTWADTEFDGQSANGESGYISTASADDETTVTETTVNKTYNVGNSIVLDIKDTYASASPNSVVWSVTEDTKLVVGTLTDSGRTNTFVNEWDGSYSWNAKAIAAGSFGLTVNYKDGSDSNNAYCITYKITINDAGTSQDDEPEYEEYKLSIHHVLNTTNGAFVEDEEVKLSKDDVAKGVDLDDYAKSDEGMSVVGDLATLTKSDFADGEASVEITYQVEEGYEAVSKEAVYTGSFDDIVIEKVGQKTITYRVVTDEGALLSNESITFEAKDGEFTTSYTVDIKPGYTAALAEGTASNFTLGADGVVTANFYKEETAAVTVEIIETAGDATYYIDTYVPNEGYEEVDYKDKASYTKTTATATGKIDTVTEVEADAKDGFVALPIEQKTIAYGNSTVVTVEYERVTYKLVYDTQGGTYVASKKGLYGTEVSVYEVNTSQETVLTCGKEEHTHTSKPSSRPENHKDETSGCYTSTSSRSIFGTSWAWTLSCGLENHTHSSSCYTTSSTTITNPMPTRTGYTFGGWYLDADCTQKADTTIVLTSDVTVYAKWIPGTMNYTIVYMKEELQSDGSYDAENKIYSYITSAVGTGIVGETVTGSGTASFDDSAYYHKGESTSETVNANGTTVVFVYYDLNTYYLTFDLNTTDNNINMTIGGSTYTKNSNPKYTITCHYGENIADRWPTSENISGNSTPFASWKINKEGTSFVSKRFNVTAEMLNSKTDKSTTQYYAEWKNGNKVILHYMLQNADDDNYTDSEQYYQEAYTDGGFSAKQIDGFTNVKSENKIVSGITNYYFYYNRDTYSITYYYKTAKLEEKTNIRFGKNINTTTYNYTPSRPDDVSSAATFGGWYDNINCLGDPYTFDTMPTNNLVLYAKWVEPTVEVTFKYVNIKDDGTKEYVQVGGTQTITAGTSPATIATPTREGYTFEGWYLDEACTNEYDFAPVTKDTVVYAKWEKNKYTTYTVYYKFGNDQGANIIDPVTKNGIIGNDVTEKAKSYTGEDGTAYVVDAISKTLTLSESTSENVITFVYKPLSDVKYKVIYTYDDKQVAGDTEWRTAESTSFTVTADQDIVNDLYKNGYLIDGATSQKVTLTGDEDENIVKFNLKLANYSISYDYGFDDVTVRENPSTYTINDSFTLSNPSKDGYIFLGWTTKDDVDNVPTDDIIAYVNIEKGSKGNLSFKAVWAKLDATGYTGTYDGNGHTISVTSEGLDDATITYTYNGKVYNSLPKFTDAGTYAVTVRANVKVHDATKVVSATANVVISPKEYSVKTEGATKEYDGTALTASGEVTGIIDEGYTFTVTGSQTEIGSSSNTYTLNWGTVKESNYTLKSEEVGTLIVTKISQGITVTTTGGTYTYDGQAHGGTVTVTGLPEGYTYEATATGTATNVSDGTVTVSCESLVIKNKAGVDVTNQMSGITYESGTVQVNAKELTVVTPDAEKVYDGTALTEGGSISGLVKGETVTFATTGTQTEVGESKNTYSLTWDGSAKQGNYTVKESLGTLKVTENTAAQITVTTTGGEFTYDGTEHKATVNVTGVPEGYKVETATSNAKATHVTYNTDKTVASIEAKCDTLKIVNAQGKDVTDKLNITYKNDIIKINPAELTVKTPSATKVYDGTELTKAGEISGFVNKETATFTTTGSQTEVGSSSNSYEITWNGTAEKNDYTVSESIGTLTVKESADEITVTTTGGSFTYDGQAHGATVTVSTLPTGYTLETATSSATATHVANGTVTATCDTLVIKNAAGEDVTSKLNIKYVDGTIEITPAPLTVTTGSAERTYDGTALTAGGSISGFVGDETATFKTTGSQTAVGSSDNTYTLVFDKNVAESDYKVTESVGTLTVNEYAGEITVTTTGGEFTYNGQAHGATVSVSELPTGYTLETATSSATATHVADGTVTATCDTLVIRNAKGEDVTSNLNIKKVDGSITIKPAALTVTTQSNSKVYDGTALTAGGNVDGYVNNETATFKVTGTQTAVGSSKNTYSLIFKDETGAENATAVKTDYTVSESIGTLTVTEYADEIVVTTTGGTSTYDGTAHGATVTVSKLPDGYQLVTAKSNDSATHVADGTVTANCDELLIKNAAGEDVTSKLNIKYVEGSITITPAKLTVTTPDASKVYDGTALTAEGNISGFVNGETATFKTTGSQTAVGSSDNTYTLTFDGTAAESDYTVSATTGTLTVTEYAGEITVTTTGGTYTYDGNAHGATVEVSELPKGYTLETATSSASVTHVAEGTVTATCDRLVIRNAAGEDVTSKLNIKKVEASISVTPATLTVTTPSDSKVYDGKALTAEGTISGFVNGETATFKTTGSQTAVGESNNTYTLTFNGTAAESDYTVNKTIGTLAVTQYDGTITVSTANVETTYDGKAHGATVTVTGLPEGYTVKTAESSASATHVKDSCDVIEDSITLVILDADGKDVTKDLKLEYNLGSITIKPATLTVTTNSASKEYDGEALTAEGKITGFVEGETAELKVTGTQTAVGESNNTYEIEWTDASAAESDYKVDATVGTLTVTESTAEITVTTKGGTFTYDGKEHGATVEVTNLPKGYTVETATSSATATHVTTEAVEATCDTLVIKNAAGEDVTSNLKNIKYVDGSITINPATLTVVTPSDSKVYDGTALTKEGTISGFVNGETATFKTTGSQTAVGSSDNTYEITWNGTAVKTDYTVSATVGTLTVTELADTIVVTANGGSYTYDGTTHTATVTVSQLPTGYTVETATSSASATHVADGTVTVDEKNITLIIKNAEGENVTGKLNIKYEPATISVTPAILTVTTPSASQLFNGNPLTASGTMEGLVNGETATFTTTGSQTYVGSSDNTYEINWNGTATASDYNVVPTVGTLTVTDYDSGTGHTPDGVVTKTIDGDKNEYGPGDKVTFTISVTNIYATPKFITITEQSGVTITGKTEFEKVQPGETVTTTATYTVTEADILKGEFSNTASAEFEGEKTFEDTVEVPLADPKAELTVTKTSDVAEGAKAALGQEINYTITVKNTGNVTVSGIEIADELTGGSWNKDDNGGLLDQIKNLFAGQSMAAINLAPGESKTVTTTYTVTEADVYAGKVVNTATATGDAPKGTDPEKPEDEPEVEGEGSVTTETEEAKPQLSVTKTADKAEAKLGETITYTITVKNSGNVTVNDIVVEDELDGAAIAAGEGYTVNAEGKAEIASLGVGDEIAVTATYKVTEADLLAGKVVNTATANGKDPAGKDIPKGKGEITTPSEKESPSLSVVKTSDVPEGETASPNQTINYYITVTNDGNVTLRNIVVEDKLNGATVVEGEGYTVNAEGKAEIASLGVGASVVVKATYKVTEADIIVGKVVNTATASGKDPDDNPVGPSDPESGTDETKTDDVDNTLDVVKTSDVEETASLGDTITYTITVTNKGNVTVSNIKVADELTGNTGDKVLEVGTLAPGESETKTTTYTVTDADIINGNVTNVAVANGTNPEGVPEGTQDPTGTGKVTDSTDTFSNKLTVKKTSDVKEGETVGLEDVITYTITVKNEGTVTISDITVEDELTGNTGDNVLKVGTLKPGESKEVTATYTVTEDDIVAGSIKNAATAEGSNPDGTPEDKPDPEGEAETEDETDPIDNTLKVEKSSDVEGTASLGDTITYTIKVTNEGNVTVSDITVEDVLTGNTGDNVIKVGTLAPGEYKTVTTAAYTVTEADIIAGKIANTATASGKNPEGTPEGTDDPEGEGTTEDKTDNIDNTLAVVKTSDVEGTASLGDTITYTIKVTNEGNVTVSDITVKDELTGDNALAIGTLAPGESKTVQTSPYTVTEADIIAGKVANTATATGKNPKGTPEGEDDPRNPGTPEGTGTKEDPTDEEGPSLFVVKTSDVEGTASLGDEITYTIKVTNNGNVTLSDITVEDELTGNIGANAFQIGTLAPGEYETVEVKYTVTENDILAGSIVNTATAKGTDPDGDPVEPKNPGKDETDTDDVDNTLRVEKTSNVLEGETVGLGDEITYTIKVTNDGNVTVSDITVEDELTDNTGDNALVIGTLAPGESGSVTATYTVTEDDIVAGSIVNVATATGKNPEGTPEGTDDPEGEGTTEDDTDDIDNTLVVEKTSDVKGTASLGDEITYTITVTNKGNVTVSNIVVADELTGETWKTKSTEGFASVIAELVGADPITLEPGESWSVETTYTVTEDDILAGKVVNTATATGENPEGTPTDPEDPRNPGTPKGEGTTEDDTDDVDNTIKVTKTSDVADGKTVALGDTITYTITVANTGNVTVSDITVEDALVGWTGDAVKTIAELAPGKSQTFTAEYTVTEADIIAGEVVNTAIASGTDPEDTPTTGTGTVKDPTDKEKPSLYVEKTSNKEGEVKLGEEITYTITVTNNGNVTVSDITVEDELTGNTGDNAIVIGTLTPGASKEVTTTYTVTEADILAGSVLNKATATGTDPEGKPVDPDQPGTDKTDTEDIDNTLEVVKKSDVEGTASLGDEITYSITVTNKGNVTVSDITVEDVLTGNTGANAFQIGTLAPGASKEVTTTYTVTEADIIAGKIANTATATGENPEGTPEGTDNPKGEGTTEDKTDDIDNTLAVEKTSDVEGTASLGDTITYTIKVTNAGNVTVSDVAVEDALTGNTGANAIQIGTLEPGASKSVTTTYTVTEADIAAGSVLNTATATGKNPDGVPTDPSDPDYPGAPEGTGTKEDPTDQDKASLFVEKTSDAEGKASLGDTITYTITVTNNGNVTVSDITVEDALTGNTGANAFQIGTLAPGASKEVTTTYTVTEADILAGSIVNTATAKGTDPDGDPVEPENPGTDETDTDDVDNTLRVEKTSNVPTGATAGLGDLITYTITVTNDGNVTVSDITVEDELTGNTGDNALVIGTLAPGESGSVTATYTVTEADILEGSIVNVATASGTNPEDVPEGTEDPEGEGEDETDTEDKDNSIEVTKTSNVTGTAALGDVITYTITVANTGNVTVDDITVEDALTGNTGDNAIVIGTLAPGQRTSVTTTYTVTEADIINGSIANIATARGTDPEDDPSEGTDEVDVPTEEKDNTITVTKTSDATGSVALGDTITYTITVANTGNVTVSDITVEDALVGWTGENARTIAALAPGQTQTFTATYTVTDADIAAGSVLNTATASGTDPEGEDTDGEGEDTTPTDQDEPSLYIEKTSNVTGTASLGDTITYTITVTNNGNVTVSDITVEDVLTGNTGANALAVGTLAAGEARSVTATYVVTEADIIAGSIINTATASGTDPDGNPVVPENPGTDETDTDPEDSTLTVNKTADTAGPVSVGDVITYTITVTNAGNVTVDDITVEDALTGNTGANALTIGTLAPGQSGSVTAAYTVTEADILRGSVANTATVSGSDPEGDPTEGEDEVDIPTEEKDSTITVSKTADVTGPVSLGDVINYTITVTNAGNVTVDDITVEDALTGNTGDNALVIGTLEPGQSRSVSAAYTVTEADILRGSVANTATASGSDTEGDPTEGEDDVDIPTEDKDSSISVVKTGTIAGTNEDGTAKTVAALGDTIDYTITVTNTGNVTENNIVVEDAMLGRTWTVATLAPGESETFTASYVVTAEDIAAGSVVNTATAEGTDPEGDRPEGEGESTVPTEQEEPSLAVVKTSDAQGSVDVGDVINYTITVINNGNVVVNNITVVDELVGWTGAAAQTIETLAPGQSQSFTAAYTVTEADIINGSVANTATAQGDDPDGESTTGEGEVVVPTVPENESLTVTKTTDVAAGTVVRTGDVINYTITVTNTGNVTVNNITVEDALTGNTGANAWTIASLAPGASQSFTTAYTVTLADAQSGSILNSAAASGTDESGIPTTGTGEVTTGTSDAYTLTIHYVYPDGTPASPDYVGTYRVGQGYNETSPTIAGYTPDYAAYVGTFGYNADGTLWNPLQDIELTVTYTGTAVPVVPVVPDGDGGVPAVVPDGDGTDGGDTTVITPDTPTGEIEVDPGTGDVEVIEVDPNPTPTANPDADHKDDILHFLIILVTFILMFFYMHYTKKRREEIEDLKEELNEDDAEKLAQAAKAAAEAAGAAGAAGATEATEATAEAANAAQN